MASASFTNLALHLAKGTIDFDNDVFYCMLTTSIPTATETTGNLDTWIYRSSALGIEHPATGNYTTGGFLVTPVGAPSLDLPSNTCSITFLDAAPAFASSTISAVGGIIFRQVGGTMATPATDELVGWVDFNGTITSTDGDFNVTFTDPLDIVV